MVWQKLPKPSTLWEEGEKWFELEDNLEEGKFDFLEYKEEPPPKGIILQRDVSVAMGPETLGTPGDFSRIWVAFTDQETGEIYLARSDDEWNQWEEYIHIIYAPSGSYQPSLTFGQDGWHRMAVTLIPAGEEIPEVWIIEPPYSGNGIRRLDLGEHPRIFQDYWGNFWVFYYKPEIGAIYSKSSKDNFASATEINLSNRGYPPLGVRLPYWEVTPYHDQFRNVLFFGSGKNMPFYVASQIEDIYTVGLDLYITKWDGSPIEGVIVEVEGQSGVTNKEGLVTFYKLPYDTTVEIKLSHPSLGLGDTQYIFIPESAKGTHVTHSLFFTKPKRKENLGVQTGLTGIEWQGTIFEHAHLVEKLSPRINLGIEWESMLVPAYVLVYSNWEDVPVYGINGMVVSSGGTTYNGLVWIEKGVSSNQDVQCDVWYETERESRANILLRASVNMDNIDGYMCGYIDGFGIYMGKRVNGVHTWIGNVSKNVQPNKWYTARFSAEGSTLRYKIWEKGTAEPSAWDLVVSDSSISEGFAGINGGHGDPERSCKWDNFILNGSLETFDTIENGSVSGWGLLRDVSSVWNFEAIEELVGYNRVYEVVPGATVQLGDQISQTNQEGLAPFHDLQGGSLQDYEITHPDYPEVSKGTILIPEGEFDFIPLKIYEKPWDGHALEEVKVHADLDVNLVAIDIEYRQPTETVSVSVGLTNILWVEVKE